MAKRIAEKNIIEGLETAAIAAESFLKVYYKAKQELEGVNSPTPRKGIQSEIDHMLNKRRLSHMRTVNAAKQNAS